MADIILKPCPFCGEEDEIALFRNYAPRYGGSWLVFVKCELCGARSRAYSTGEDADSPDFWESDACLKAASRWNHRAGGNNAQ